MSKKHKPALGRGLNSLLGGHSLSTAEERTADPLGPPEAEAIREMPFALIKPNAAQPRRAFDEASLLELAESIKHLGLIQPITVMPVQGGMYQIISGERRYRASRLAGLERVPVYIRSVGQGELLEMALVENIQREDLNAIEIALAYQQLIETTGQTQEAVAERVGKKRATISNYLRLLRLPSQIQLALSQRLLDMGHARALLQVEDVQRQIELYELILADKLSVREVEELARRMQVGQANTSQAKAEAKGRGSALPQEYKMLERHLGKVFSTKVALRYSSKGRGQISIPFSSEEDLERIMHLLERIQQ